MNIVFKLPDNIKQHQTEILDAITKFPAVERAQISGGMEKKLQVTFNGHSDEDDVFSAGVYLGALIMKLKVKSML